MGLTRSELREKIMIILYQIDILKKNNIAFDIDKVIKDNVEIDNEFVKDVVYGVTTHENDIVAKANEFLIDWDLSRIDKTGSSILKMAIYEMDYTDTPKVVIINEAVELAKKYSDENVRKIINGVLDRMANNE